MRLEVISIPSGDDLLAGLHYRPDRTPNQTVIVYAHGFTSGKYSMDGLASYLAGRGYEGVTFDAIGHKLGGSGGAMHTIFQAADNLQDTLHWVRQHTSAQKIVLIGHSMGAAAAIQVAANEAKQQEKATPPLAGMICLCTGLEPSQGFNSVIGQTMLTQRSDYVSGSPARQLLTELDTMVRAVVQIGDLPALFVAARQDVLISVAQVEALAALAGDRAAFESLDSSHLEAPDRARAAVMRWLEQQNV